MPIYKGNKNITKVYQGETEIDKVYRGASKVYGADKGTEITVSGNPLVLTNVAKEKALDTLEINGRTEQVQLQGYNLWQQNWIPNRENYNGVTLINNGDGTYTLNGTCISSGNFQFDISLEAGTYVLKANSNATINNSSYLVQIYSFSLATGNGVYNKDGVNGYVTFTFNSDTSAVARIRIQEGITYDNLIVKPQLEKGSVAHSYEPYCGGIPSPNPDYPQEIVNVNSLEVVQSGKNLIPSLDTNNFQYTIYMENERGIGIIENGVFKLLTQTFPNTDTAFVLKSKGFIKLPKNKMLYLSFQYKTNIPNYTVQRATVGATLREYRTQIVDESNNVSTLNQYPTSFINDEQWHVFSSTINTLDSENYKLYIGGDSPNFPVDEGYYLFIQNIQLSLSDVVDFEPYKPIRIATIDGIELTKWDKIVKRNGVWGVSKNHYEHTVNRVSVFYSTSNPNGNICYFSPPNYNKVTFSVRNFLCDKFMVSAESIDKMPLYSICGVSGAGSTCWICLPKDITSAIEANQYLANNTAKLIYPTVAEQSFTPLSQTIQDQLNAMQIYKPTTVISNDNECEMSATYLCYLDKTEAMLTNLYLDDLKEVLQ